MKLDLASAALAAALALAAFGLPAAPALAGATTGHWKDGTSYSKYKKYEKYGYSKACHNDRRCRERYWRQHDKHWHDHHHHAHKSQKGVTVKVR
ncbi:hypothetical protein WDZ92_30615 [Nostoc sp. NIES-2111]